MPGPGMELIGEEEIQEVLKVMRRGYLFRYGVSLGPEVDPRFLGKVFEVEQEVARLLRLSYAVAVNSGTSALLTALAGLGIGPGDEVIVPGYTFIASLSSIIFSRAVPVLAEVDRTFNLDPRRRRGQDHAPHQGDHGRAHDGEPGPLGRAQGDRRPARAVLDRGLRQAFGATYHGRPVGAIGHDRGVQLQRL